MLRNYHADKTFFWEHRENKEKRKLNYSVKNCTPDASASTKPERGFSKES